MLSVLQMVPRLESGGVEQGTLEVAQELVRLGHRSLVISAGGRLVDQLTAAGSEHITWNVGKKSPLSLRWVLPLRRLLQEQRVDLLHVRSRVPAWIAWCAWRSLPVEQRPVFLTTAHGLYGVNIYSSVMTRGEKVIAISHTVRDYLLKNYPHLTPDRIRLVYRGVDPHEFPYNYRPTAHWTAQFHRDFPQLGAGPIITLPGRLTRLKGHADFLKIVSRLRAAFPTLKALIVGGEDPRRQQYATELRHIVREQQLESTVLFTGHRSDIREILASSQVVLSLTSQPPEAFGRTTLEALSLGVPVVGYGHSGVGEILEKLFPFGQVAPGDLEAVTARCTELLQHPKTVSPNTFFTRESMLRAELAVYEELTKDRQVTRRTSRAA